MAVPKKKTSKSRSRTRKAHDALSPVQCTADKESGMFHMSHHISKDGFYKGRDIFARPSKEQVGPVAGLKDVTDSGVVGNSGETPNDLGAIEDRG
jgi:large subunit ribosomal protein L32